MYQLISYTLVMNPHRQSTTWYLSIVISLEKCVTPTGPKENVSLNKTYEIKNLSTLLYKSVTLSDIFFITISKRTLRSYEEIAKIQPSNIVMNFSETALTRPFNSSRIQITGFSIYTSCLTFSPTGSNKRSIIKDILCPVFKNNN